MNTTLKLLVYCRVSSQEQKKNETIERQLERIPIELKKQRLLKEDGGQYELYSRSPLSDEVDPSKVFFVDNGFNLESIPENTALFEAIELIRTGEINGLFIDSTDRLLRSRSAEIRGRIQDLLDLHEVKVFSNQGEIPRGVLLEIMSAFGSEDKKAIGRKLQSGKISKTKNLGAPSGGCPPYGYDWDKRKKEWVVMENEAQILRWIVATTAGVSCEGLPGSLRELVDQHPDGVPDPTLLQALIDLGVNKVSYYERTNRQHYLKENPEGNITRNWLHTLLKGDRYCGEKTFYFRDPGLVGKGKLSSEKKERVVVQVPAIVSRDQWTAAQAARARRACVEGKNVKNDYLLEKIAYCSSCGSPMSARTGRNKKWVASKKSVQEYLSLYYVCGNSAKHRPNPCSCRRTHNARSVDPLVWNKVVRYLQDPDFIVANENIIREDRTLQKTIDGLQAEYSALDFKLKQLEKKMGRLLDAFIEGAISNVEHVAKKKELQIEKLQLEKRKSKIRIDLHSKEKLLKEMDRVDVAAIQERYRDRLASLSFGEKRSVLTALVKQVSISSSNEIHVNFRLPV